MAGFFKSLFNKVTNRAEVDWDDLEADLIAAVHATGLDGEAIRNVRLLENFVLFEVPAEQAERVTGSVDGTDVRGHTLRLELANA